VTADVAVFRELDVDYDDAVLRSFYDDVLDVSFEEDELDDLDTFRCELRGEAEVQALATVAIGGGGRVLGGIVGEIYAQAETLLIAYLAIRPDIRARGIGSALVRYALPRWQARADVSLTVAEVHDPRHWREPSDAADDRVRFFGQAGALVLGIPFVQPALSPGRARIPGFLLVVFPTGAEREVPSAEVGRFVKEYYAVAEHVRPPFDVQLADLLAQIERRSAVPLYPIADYAKVPLPTA
jgi:GNAT superfamily N-acetyltransferase